MFCIVPLGLLRVGNRSSNGGDDGDGGRGGGDGQ